MKSNEFVIYAKKIFVQIKIIKKNLNKSKKSEIIVIITGKYRGAAHSICNLRYKIPREIPVVFHNGSAYDYHFIIRQLAKEFKSNFFDCQGESTEKYITFSVPIKKKRDNDKAIIYKLKFIDSYRFMSDSLSSLVDNLSEIDEKEPENKFIDNMRSMMASLSQSINKVSEIDQKISQIDEKEPENKYIDNTRSMMVSLSQSIDKVSEIDEKISRIDKKEPENKFIDSMRSMIASLSQSIGKVSEIDEKISQIELIKKFPNTYQLSDKDPNEFALLLRKGVYPYEYMDRWERFNEKPLEDKEYFYNELNKEGITDEDFAHYQKVCKVFKIKNLGKYHDLYVQSNTLLLADVFKNFRDKCIEIYELDPVHLLSSPGLAWQAYFKKTGVKLELLTDNDMLMIIEKGIRGGMCHATYRYAIANNKYMKNYDKNKESSYLEYLDANNQYGWVMLQKLPVGNFKWI